MVTPGSEPADLAEGVSAWFMFAEALTQPGEGLLFLGGDVSILLREEVEDALLAVGDAIGVQLKLGAGRVGSWWRKFRIKVGAVFSDADLQTLKRAAEVQALDRYESEAAAKYAEAVKSLAEAAGPSDHAFLMARNTLLVKGITPEGKVITAARTLTPGEIDAFQSGVLQHVLADPRLALLFVQGQLQALDPDGAPVPLDRAVAVLPPSTTKTLSDLPEGHVSTG